MKKRFYIDVPEFGDSYLKLIAFNDPPTYAPLNGWKRVAFDVDFPPSVFKTNSDIAISSVVGIVESET